MRSLEKILVEAILIAVAILLAMMWGIDHGTKYATKNALRTNPPSEELELVCAGLWIGEQNLKYQEKDRARKY